MDNISLFEDSSINNLTEDQIKILVEQAEEKALDYDYARPGQWQEDTDSMTNPYILDAVQDMAISIDPYSILSFNYPVKTKTIENAIQSNDQVLRAIALKKDAESIKGTFKRKVLIDLYDRLWTDVSPDVIKDALDKNGLLVEYIPGNVLKEHPEYCITAVLQDKDAFDYVPKGVSTEQLIESYSGRLEEKEDRVDKNFSCVTPEVVKAYLSHMDPKDKDSVKLINTLSPLWVNEDVVKYALGVNPYSLSTFAHEYGEYRKYVVDQFKAEDDIKMKDLGVISYNHGTATKLKPEIRDMILENVSKENRFFRAIPNSLYSVELTGDCALLGSDFAKSSFQAYPLRYQMAYLDNRLRSGLLKCTDMNIISRPKYEKAIRDELLMDSRAESYVSVLDQYPKICSYMSAFSDINRLCEDLGYMSRGINTHNRDVNKTVAEEIAMFDWNSGVSADFIGKAMFEEQKLKVALQAVSLSSLALGEVTSKMYPTGIPSEVFANQLYMTAINNSAFAIQYVPNPTPKLAIMACDKSPIAVKYVDPEVIGQENWNKYALSAVKLDPTVIKDFNQKGVELSNGFIRAAVLNNPNCTKYFTDRQKEFLKPADISTNKGTLTRPDRTTGER